MLYFIELKLHKYIYIIVYIGAIDVNLTILNFPIQQWSLCCDEYGIILTTQFY